MAELLGKMVEKNASTYCGSLDVSLVAKDDDTGDVTVIPLTVFICEPEDADAIKNFLDSQPGVRSARGKPEDN